MSLADYGEVKQPGFLGRLFGQLPTIVRDADIAAATESLPEGVTVLKTDPNGNWVLYQTANSAQFVRFRAWEAWLPNEPTITQNETRRTGATIDSTGRVVITEGLHRTRATARDRLAFKPDLGGVEGAPGWLDFAHAPDALRDTPSTRAIVEMMGGDLDAPLIRAR